MDGQFATEQYLSHIERVLNFLALERNIWPSQYNICVNWAWRTAEVDSSSRMVLFIEIQLNALTWNIRPT
jgi:hypothetical protein